MVAKKLNPAELLGRPKRIETAEDKRRKRLGKDLVILCNRLPKTKMKVEISEGYIYINRKGEHINVAIADNSQNRLYKFVFSTNGEFEKEEVLNLKTKELDDNITPMTAQQLRKILLQNRPLLAEKLKQERLDKLT